MAAGSMGSQGIQPGFGILDPDNPGERQHLERESAVMGRGCHPWGQGPTG